MVVGVAAGVEELGERLAVVAGHDDERWGLDPAREPIEELSQSGVGIAHAPGVALLQSGRSRRVGVEVAVHPAVAPRLDRKAPPFSSALP